MITTGKPIMHNLPNLNFNKNEKQTSNKGDLPNGWFAKILIALALCGPLIIYLIANSCHFKP
jgi:hypothetical protein